MVIPQIRAHLVKTNSLESDEYFQDPEKASRADRRADKTKMELQYCIDPGLSLANPR